MIKVYDNWLTDDVADYARLKFLRFTPPYYVQVSVPNGISLYSEEMNNTNSFGYYEYKKNTDCNKHAIFEDSFLDYLHYRLFLNQEMHSYICDRCYINIQYHGQDGNWHVDGCDITALWMSSSSNDDSGYLEFKDTDEKIPYVKNRLVLFNGNMSHRAISLSNSHKQPRITLAFKMNKVKE